MLPADTAPLLVEAVLFDLDGTLLDRDASLLAFVRDQYQRLHRGLGHVPEDAYVARVLELDQRGHVWKDEVYRRLVVDLAICGIGWEALLDDFLGQFHRHCVGFPNLHATLARLSRAGLRLGIISNGRGDFQMASVRALGIEHYFSVVTISEWAGTRKPEAAIFQQTLAKLGTPAARAVFVGDHPVSDMGGARRVGMRAVWKRDRGWPEPAASDVDAVIDDLAELPLIVERFSC